MHLHELLPRPLLLSLRGGLDSILRQDAGHRRPSDLDLHPGPKGVSDLRVAPARVRLGHLDHQFPDVPPLARPADPASRAVVLPRAQLPKPRQERRRLHNLAAFPAFLRGQRLASHRQATTLLRRERDPSAAGDRDEDILQNPDLFLRVVQLALHPLVDRACDHRDEKLERRREH